jgi:2-dehydropantoate 2-reductase
MHLSQAPLGYREPREEIRMSTTRNLSNAVSSRKEQEIIVDEAAEVTIVGAGGVGCALGHALLAGGIDVTFVEKNSEKLEWGRRNGVVVDQKLPRPASFVHFNEWHPSSADLILLCTKCYDNRAVIEQMPGSVELIPIQNGFDSDLFDRVRVEAIASFITECIPGRTQTRITRPGDLHIGFQTSAKGHALPAPVETLIGTFERHGGFTVRRVAEVLPFKYTKLMYNAAISPIAAIGGLDNGQLLTISRARTLFFGLLRENYRILKRAGAPLERIGPFHPDTVYRLLRLPLVVRMLAIPFSRTLRGTYCSMAGDLPNGPTELVNYNGHLLELAGDQDVPLNREVYALAKEVEERGLAPDHRWLEELFARLPAPGRNR